MSKLPFWTPPNQGTVSQNMPVFRVKGYPPDAPETHILLEAFSGSVKQFYLGQARNAALAVGEQWAKTVDRGDHQIRYQSSFGTETVTLHVHPKRAHQLLTAGEGWWDSALVEITLPATNQVGGYFSAFVVSPRLEEITDESYLPVKGVALDASSWAGGAAYLPNPIVAFPSWEYDNIPYNRGDRDTQVASLRIDLRPFRGLTNVSVDLYGLVTPGSVQVLYGSSWDGYFARKFDPSGSPWAAEYNLYTPGTTQTNRIVSAFPEYAGYASTAGGYGDIFGIDDAYDIQWYVPNMGFFGGPLTPAKWESGHWGGITPDEWLAAYPAGSTTTEWGPGITKTEVVKSMRFRLIESDGVTYTDYTDAVPPTPPYGGGEYIGLNTAVDPPEGVYSFPATGTDLIRLYTPQYAPENVLEDRPATLTGACFLGVPFDTWSEYTADAGWWRQWEVSQTYPERPNLGSLGEVTVPAVDDLATPEPSTLQNKWEQRLLGRINIDPRYPRGGVTFKPV